MIESIVTHLQRVDKLENSTDVERFDAALSQIASLNDPKAIGLLIPFFDDKCRFPEAMFSMVHTIERFDDETYVRELLKTLPDLWRRSPYWASVLHFRIFNHPPTREAYRTQLAQADPSIRAATRGLLTTLRAKEPKFRQVCDEMLAIL